MIYSHFVFEMLLPQTTAPLYVPLGNLPLIGRFSGLSGRQVIWGAEATDR